MREILFRGKDSQGNWHYSMTIARAAVTGGEISHIYFGACPTESIPAKTVGQYIGLTDKNGKKIFEGDILKRQWGDYPFQCVYYTVEFNFGEFELVEIKSKSELFIAYHCECEIIGNIHDNPELLRGDK